MTQAALILASNSSATSADVFTWPGGIGMFSVEATWGGGNVALQFQTIHGTWIAVGTNTNITTNGGGGFILPAGTSIRAAITTATAVYAYAIGLSA